MVTQTKPKVFRKALFSFLIELLTSTVSKHFAITIVSFKLKTSSNKTL